MRTTTDPGFVQADSYNLPEVTCEMIDIYYEEIAEYFIAGVRNVKAQRYSILWITFVYLPNGFGYVQLKRDHPQCIVKARITPEHKIRKQSYLVSVCIDEECHKVIDVKCNDYEASEGSFQATAPIINSDHFLQFAKTVLTPEICKKICQITKTQSECPEWFAARFGRITVSKLHEVAHCHTYDGTTLEAVLGARKFTPSKAMRRGLILEKQVLQVLYEEKKICAKRCGFTIKPEVPIFGASPDAITKHHCIEIKCPSRADTTENYYKNGTITEKCYAQVQLQMFLCDRQKSLFCVASPDFEEDKQITTIEVALDKAYCSQMIADALQFWKEAVFAKLNS
ncbi:unnamed protein product [Ceutorhynchus assimilis]|uniref:YqaJ viral recombinase domain-containing protein n=1 Tax=Ceutorhynchus assimilis TaxID=467358 RepID=A0A9N9MXU6_9CUCU|nr:unnamed protein product [Ceutorhynchus assimilis]